MRGDIVWGLEMGLDALLGDLGNFLLALLFFADGGESSKHMLFTSSLFGYMMELYHLWHEEDSFRWHWRPTDDNAG